MGMNSPMTATAALQILLVEDDPGMVVLASDRLTDVPGWRVTTADSAAQCRERIAAQTFDVTLLDRGLPDCDGSTLIREILAAQPDAVIIMLTGADSAASATEALQFGACDYIVKQVDGSHLDALPDTISRSVERARWRREEAKLRSDMELLSTAIRAAGDAVVITDCEGHVRFWNLAAEKLFGWNAAAVMGTIVPLVPEERMAEALELMKSARRGDPLVGVETKRRRRDGSVVEVSLTLTAATARDGSVRAYVGVMRDISERKALERARTDFLAMLTHDIKNPVGVVRGCAEMLAESELSEEDAESVCAIHQAAATIDRLVTDLLISATIESGQLTLARNRVRVDDLVSAAAEQFRTAATRQRIALDVQSSIDTGYLEGDRYQLERALGNLINNALKYTGPGGRISVGVTRRNGRILFHVCDTGPGISSENIPHLFDKYRRILGNGQIDGVGLGLYIVRHLVEAHGGSVAVSSAVGRGSTFVISLPAADATASATNALR
jgi:PAS domain S-box-containing protein